MNRMYEKYKKEVMPKLIKEFDCANALQAPRLEKVVLNVGVKDALKDEKLLTAVSDVISTIAGQRAMVTRAKKSIAGFKLRAGDAIGVSVTLRGTKMYDFLDKLFTIVLPRVRDFRGVNSDAFDGKGNYSLGLKELTVFAEVDYNKVDKLHGVGISIVTTARSDEEGRTLLALMGMPFRKD